MVFRQYLRWEGAVLLVVGAGLYLIGTVEGHQTHADAVVSGLIMTTGTGVFLVLRHGVRLRQLGSWFTQRPLARAARGRAPCSRRSLVLAMAAEAVAMAAVTVGLSHATNFWLTYMDFGVWALVIGAIKIGPSVAAIARHELDSGTTYRVTRRPLRGLVELSAD